jgi:hypothetical protein
MALIMELWAATDELARHLFSGAILGQFRRFVIFDFFHLRQMC